MRVYLDDVRNTPDGWLRCYWPSEVIELLKTGKVTEISLDHDLGDADKAKLENRREITGRMVLEWIEEKVFVEGMRPPILRIHSDNGPGIDAMRRAIASIMRQAQGELHEGKN